MTKEILYEMTSPYRDSFRICGYRFGKGEKAICIVGSLRGDEIQQQYVCSQLVRKLRAMEESGAIRDGVEILVIPSANPFSMNIGKRFWAMDGTDINRMFPGYELGETTQRIAKGLFDRIQGFQYGIQLASFYVPGNFIPHIRILETGYESTDEARIFGLPYVCLRKPKPFDTVLLNYNWQIWETKAFSLYSGTTQELNRPDCRLSIQAILRFMSEKEMIDFAVFDQGFNSKVLHEELLVNVKSPASGVLICEHHVTDVVRQGELLARVLDPYTGEVIAEIVSPTLGIIFFAHNKPLALKDTPVFKIIKG